LEVAGLAVEGYMIASSSTPEEAAQAVFLVMLGRAIMPGLAKVAASHPLGAAAAVGFGLMLTAPPENPENLRGGGHEGGGQW
jgi:hypothetical protein